MYLDIFCSKDFHYFHELLMLKHILSVIMMKAIMIMKVVLIMLIMIMRVMIVMMIMIMEVMMMIVTIMIKNIQTNIK